MTAMQMCAALWSMLCVVWLVTALRTKQTLQRAAVASRVGYGALVLLAFYLMFSDVGQGSWLGTRVLRHTSLLMNFGVLLTAAGIGLAIWARLHIGSNWSSAVSIKVGHQLIRTGPYAYVRHPIYSGILLAMAGTSLVRGQPRGFIAVLLLVVGLFLKLQMEEHYMRTTFGPEYDEYSRSTGALVPRLRR